MCVCVCVIVCLCMCVCVCVCAICIFVSDGVCVCECVCVCVCGANVDNLPVVALGNVFGRRIVDLKRLVGLISSQISHHVFRQIFKTTVKLSQQSVQRQSFIA